MNPKEPLDERLKMVKMHDDVMKRIDTAIKKKNCIEACWLCYSCMDNRITRTLEKLSEKCCKRNCYNNPRVGISSRIACLKRLIKKCYAGTELIESKLLGDIQKWCKTRNTYVHNLITLNNYENIDEKFMTLAKEGKPLVDALYKQMTEFRENYYNLKEMPEFPKDVEQKCQLRKKSKQK